MKVILNNTELNALGVHGRTMTYQGLNRDTLTFLFDPSVVSLAEVQELFTEGCESITLVDDEGNTFVHEYYNIRIALGQGDKEIALGQGGSNNPTEEVVYVRMAQTTLQERLLLQQKSINEEQDDALIEIYGLMLGEE